VTCAGLVRRRGASSPLSAPGNHVADCTPVSLAELLAPPFGDTGASLRHSRRTAITDPRQQQQQQQQPATNDRIFDDDSGTDI